MINMLKNLLLNTGYFKDNEYLTAYISLLNEHTESNSGYVEQHHIIPAAVYRYKYSCKNGIEARQLADADEKNSTVLLLYKDHVLAHYFLYFCTLGKVKHAMAQAITCMVGNLEVDQLDFSEFRYLPEQFDKIQQLIDRIHADPDNSFYTPYEVEFLKLYYGANGAAFCAKQLNRPLSSVKAKANRLRLHLDTYKPWTENEKQIVRQYYEEYGPDYCNNLLINRDKNSIRGLAKRLGLQCGRYWSTEEEKFLIENYAKLGGKKCAECLCKPYRSVRSKASTLKLLAKNAWANEEIEVILKYYKTNGAEYCARLIGRELESIRNKAYKLGLTETHLDWSAEELEFLKQNYIHYGSKFCADALPGRTRASITAQANKLGLKIKNRQKEHYGGIN